jgi:hypothetical protein
MEARRVNKCYYDEERESFHQECIIAVVNALVGAPVLNNANFEGAYIQSSKVSNSNLRLRYVLGLPDGSQHEIPLFFGTRYGNSSGLHINSKHGEFPAEFNNAQIELVKAIMRIGSRTSRGYLTMLRGSARNYEGNPIFRGEQEMLARRFENLQQEEAEEAAGGGGGGGAAYQEALGAARAEARQVGRNAYMHNLSAAGANVRAAAMAGYEAAREQAERNIREQAMRNYIAALGPVTAAQAEGGAAASGAAAPVMEVDNKTIKVPKKKGGYRKKRKTKKYSRRR